MKKMKTIVIEEKVHDVLKKHCKENNLKINEYVNKILKDHLQFTLESESQLPLVLKNSKEEIVETIICSSISREYKKNMPTEITLIRNVDDEGHIANYTQK